MPCLFLNHLTTTLSLPLSPLAGRGGGVQGTNVTEVCYFFSSDFNPVSANL